MWRRQVNTNEGKFFEIQMCDKVKSLSLPNLAKTNPVLCASTIIKLPLSGIHS